MTLESRVEDLRRRHGYRSGADLLGAMLGEFGPRLAVISSFGIESAALLAVLSTVDRGVPVIFLDTDELFDETHAYRETLTQRLGLTDLRHVRPTPQELAAAEDLWLTDPDRCCALRKVAPLHRVVEGFEALVDGRKRLHGGGRESLQSIEAGDKGVVKISPLASWSQQQIDEICRAHDLPPHPLAAQGFRSVGCWPCSRAALPGEGPRGGRWSGRAKSECGIHAPGFVEAAQ